MKKKYMLLNNIWTLTKNKLNTEQYQILIKKQTIEHTRTFNFIQIYIKVRKI